MLAIASRCVTALLAIGAVAACAYAESPSAALMTELAAYMAACVESTGDSRPS